MTTITSARLLLPVLTLADATALDRGTRLPEWADGYPIDADVMLARMTLAGGVEPTDWGLRRVLTHDGTVVGGIGLFGPPDEDGRVSFGYGLAVSTRGHGYATEAVIALTDWAGSQGARLAHADTLTTNIPSQRVLERAGFVRTGERDGDEGRLVDWEKPVGQLSPG